MKTYLQMDGGQLVEYVEKREYDGLSLLAHELATLRAEDMATINDLRQQLQDVVKRMEAVNWESWADVPSTHAALEGLHSELIQVAKGEQS